jgi:hypothetical protein
MHIAAKLTVFLRLSSKNFCIYQFFSPTHRLGETGWVALFHDPTAVDDPIIVIAPVHI